MALTTYTELKASIADFLNRDDLTTVIPDFITLAEAQINRDVRHWKMEARSSGVQDASDEYMQIPSDWIETIRLHLTGSGTSVVNLISRDAMADKRQGDEDVSGTPMYYTHADGQFQLYPTPSADTDFELLYYQKLDVLSGSNADNWLLLDSPDVYLYGALLHSAPYLAEDERVAIWAQMYSAAVTRLNEASESARYSGSGLRLKIRGLG
tara:strand:- start:1612 stop:2241 length:630 start_codon:yes stop_codon:yes gene_type:complete